MMLIHHTKNIMITKKEHVKKSTFKGVSLDVELNPGDSYSIPENVSHSFEVIEGREVIDVYVFTL